MSRYKICFWLNVPSNHQTLFLEALSKDERIDLQVRYFEKPNEDRLKMGWRDENTLSSYEHYVTTVEEGLNSLENWKERIHIIMGYSYSFNLALVPLLIENKVKWVHWSERYGIGLAQRLNYNVKLFQMLRPLFLMTKKSYGKLVNKYALGCFSQGELARQDFIKIGIDNKKIEDLYYTTAALVKVNQIPDILKFFPYKYKFLYVGRLNQRKGIEDLLIAFSGLTQANNWGLVLVGNDETKGYFKQISKKIGIDHKVIFTDGVKSDEVPDFFNSCDVCILPSRFDGWGAVLNEAVSIGLPIIATDQSGAAFHLLEHEENGYRYSAGNSNRLKEAMQHYVSDNKLLDLHAINSYKIIKNFYPEKNVERFISAIEKWDNGDLYENKI